MRKILFVVAILFLLLWLAGLYYSGKTYVHIFLVVPVFVLIVAYSTRKNE